MNLKVFQYYLIPHPLLKKESAIVSDAPARDALRNAVWEFCRGYVQVRPKILRLLISPEKNNDDILKSRYFKRLKQKEDREFSSLKLRVCMNFLGGLLVGYILYLAPPSFWEPIETVFDSVAHGLSDYAKLWIILFFPIRSFIRNFGTGIQFALPGRVTGNPVFRRIPLIGRIRRIGAAGRWQLINRTAGSTELYPIFEKDLSAEFSEDIRRCVSNIEKKSGDAKQLLCRLKELTDRIISGYSAMDSDALDSWNREYLKFLEDASAASGTGAFPWGEIPKLDRLRQDLVFFGGINKFIFAPVTEIYPEADDPGVYESKRSSCKPQIIDLNLSIRTASALRQSINLRQFFNDPEIDQIMNRIYSDFEKLECAGNPGATAELLDSLGASFALLRDHIAEYHMGGNYAIPNEKGRDLPDFYHNLYLIFGRASCDIHNRYKRAGWGLRPLLSFRAVKRRVREAVDEAFDLIENRKLRRSGRVKDGITYFLGKSAAAGLAAAASLLFLFGSVISFYTLRPDQTAVLNSVRIGYQEEFISNAVSSRDYGTGVPLPGSEKELFWHLPPPFTRMQRISLSEPSEITVHMVIGESHTDNPWKKFLRLMSGQLGMSFYVAELTFEYLPENPETWKNYDADGKGSKRLIRDASTIVEEWKTGIISSYEGGMTSLQDAEEINYIFTTYFRELSGKGVIEDYIRRSFSQTVLSTHVYYGSPLERLEPGFITVLDELDRRFEEYGRDPLLDAGEKAELQESMKTAKTVVEETLERIEAQVEVEYGDLRRHPDMLMKMVRDPYLHLQELRNFETLWSGIQSYTWYLYNQEKMRELFSAGRREASGPAAVPDGKDYIQDMISAVSDDPHLSRLIRITAVEYVVKDMGVAKLNLIQQKWKDII